MSPALTILRALRLLSLLLCVSAASIPSRDSGDINQAESTVIRREDNFTNPTPPPCYLQCRDSILPTSNCIDSNDLTCICHDNAYLAAESDCMDANCKVLDHLTALRYQTTILCHVKPRNRSGLISRVSWGLYGISVFATLARFISRLPSLGGTGYGPDDWTCILSLLILLPGSVCVHIMAENGLGQDMWMLPTHRIDTVHLWFWISGYIYTFVLVTTKISIILLYLRMWPETDASNRRFRDICHVLLGVLVVAGIVVAVVWSVECTPTHYIWTRWAGEDGGNCLSGSEATQAVIYASIHIALDIVVVTLPIPKLLKLSFASTRKKIAVCIAFSAGLALTICSIVRVPYLGEWGNSMNDTWTYGSVAMWSNIEASVTIFSACVPAIMGLTQRVWVHFSTGAPFRTYRGSMSDAPYELRLRSNSVSRQMDRNGEFNDAKRMSSPYPYPAGGFELSPGKEWRMMSSALDNESLESPSDGAAGFSFGTTRPLPPLAQPENDDQGFAGHATEPLTFLDRENDDVLHEEFHSGATQPLPPMEQEEEEPVAGFRVDATKPLPPPTRKERREARRDARQAAKKKREDAERERNEP